MKKSTKIITTAVALALVVAAMVVGIYAATAGSATITANVSWTATAGITFEFNGKVEGGALKPAAVSHVVVSSTTNTGAAGTGNLSENFIDSDKGTAQDNGVNDPGAIIYTYTIKNTTASAIKIKLTKAPAQGAESGATAAEHKPAVAYEVTGVTGASLATLQGTDGVSLPTGDTLTVKITLSMASGSDATTDADLGINSFDASVTFSMGL